MVHVGVVMLRQGPLLEIVATLRAPRRFARDWTAGSSRAMSVEMMAITTSNSMSVKARLTRNDIDFPLRKFP